MAKSRTASRHGFSIVSLTSRSTARVLFQRFGQTSKAHRDLRRALFVRITANSTLQRRILEVLAKHPEAQQEILQELARDPQFRTKLLKVAGQ
ncbi:MAG: hypothetical protein DMG96_35205 [Acidobacteria bacterium]|nr:MAG: hypothetical protein DMG98_22065 [Acidobacteriota bacterium]PYV68963.1 MAG: hypothetical protein DMG96_35205 [Acidobacteriota bacterium]